MLPASAVPVIVGVVLLVIMSAVDKDDGAVGAMESNISLVNGSANPTTPELK